MSTSTQINWSNIIIIIIIIVDLWISTFVLTLKPSMTGACYITTVKNFPVQCDDIVSSHGIISPSENRHIELSPRGMIFYRLKRWWNMSRFVTILYRLMWWWVIVTQVHHLMGRYQIVTWDVCNIIAWDDVISSQKNDINTSHETVNLIWFLR